MRNWESLEPDEYKLLSRHYTKGRAGHRIDKVILHHNAANLSVQGCWQTWQNRAASAQYQVDAKGWIGQLVHDSDTSWNAANSLANMTSIAIEHADITSNPWTISEATLDNGAHLVAALCKAYRLGRPTWLRNVFPHSYFAPTQCPGSINGSQHEAYMRRAQKYYDEMTGGKVETVVIPAVNRIINKVVNAAAHGVPQIDVDGLWGAGTIKRVQQLVGTPDDGQFDHQLNTNRWRVPRATTGWQWGTNPAGSKAVRSLQARLGVDPDGLIGYNTIRAWQARLGVDTDGIAGNKTVRAIQTALNNNKLW